MSLSNPNYVRGGLQVVSCKQEATFKTQPLTNVTGEALTVGGSGDVSGNLADVPGIKPKSFVATSNTSRVATDDGKGNIQGDISGSGTIDYITGAIAFTFDDGASSTSATADYSTVGENTDLLYLAGRAVHNEVGNSVDDPIVKSHLGMNDSQFTDYDGDNSFPLSVRLNESGNVDFLGANGQLVEGLLGNNNWVDSTSVAAGSWTTTVFDLASGGGTGRNIGDMIAIELTGATPANKIEVRMITGVSGDTITVFPGFSVAPATADVVRAVRNYYLNDPDVDPSTLWFNIYKGKNYLIESGGQRVNALNFEFPLSGLVGLTATTNGAAGPDDFNHDEVTTPFNPTGQSDSGKQPMVAMNMTILKDGTELTGCRVTNATVNITSENQNDKTVEGGRTVCRSIRGPITVDGQIDVFIQDVTDINLFRNETRGSLLLVAGDTAGASSDRNLMAVLLPRIKYNAGSVDEEGLEEKFTLPFRAEDPIINSVRVPERQVTVAVFE